MNLFKKYDVPAPRYTSYPTVPAWNDSPTTQDWLASMQSAMAKDKSKWSLYIHIPYCETLCTFCGCNTVITKNHGLENVYVDRLLKEFDIYLQVVPDLQIRPLANLHLGGGTPTFLSAQELDRLVGGILSKIKLAKNFEGSIEVDPRRTREDQLVVLKKHGFDRISLGVQDLDPEVQRLINRHQTEEETLRIVDISRRLGYSSVNFDLIYGLPQQSVASIEKTVRRTIEIRPDRIALYSFALVPWIKPAQRLFKDEDLPAGQDKRNLYERSRELFLAAGYVEIGMDHFALPSDHLSKSMGTGTLHRNFMGYTDQHTNLLLALGVSGISESEDCYHQNEKVLTVYERRIDQGEIATLRGHKLNFEDQEQKKLILELMTTGSVNLSRHRLKDEFKRDLQEMEQDGLIQWTPEGFSISDTGKPFLRNACLALDLRWRNQNPTGQIFSRSI